MKKVYSFVLLGCLLCLGLSELQAATLHAILVINDQDPIIKDGCAKDKENMTKYLRRMARSYSNLPPKIKILEGRSFQRTKVLQALSSLQTQEDDVVVFYFSGHGLWSDDKGFLLEMTENQHIKFEDINALLDQKLARLKLLLTDCCKKEVSTRGTSPDLVIPVDNPIIDNNFKWLLSCSGTLVATSCEKNQESFTDTGGSYFTLAFLQAISYYVENNIPDWVGIAEKAKWNTRLMAQQKLRIQTPVIELKIKNP
ncbi:MAG: caspase family protein [Bacteroidota bacterium]